MKYQSHQKTYSPRLHHLFPIMTILVTLVWSPFNKEWDNVHKTYKAHNQANSLLHVHPLLSPWSRWRLGRIVRLVWMKIILWGTLLSTATLAAEDENENNHYNNENKEKKHFESVLHRNVSRSFLIKITPKHSKNIETNRLDYMLCCTQIVCKHIGSLLHFHICKVLCHSSTKFLL